jgi:hypothetical protein
MSSTLCRKVAWRYNASRIEGPGRESDSRRVKVPILCRDPRPLTVRGVAPVVLFYDTGLEPVRKA